MSRSVALDPVVTRTGTTKITTPPPARSTTFALDPVCRRITGDQTVTPTVAT